MPLVKDIDLMAVGTLGWDHPERVSELTDDGRNDLVAELPPRPSGLGANGLPAAWSVLAGTRVAMAGLAGAIDGAALTAALRAHRIDPAGVILVPGQPTRRQRVSLDPTGRRVITRLPGGPTAEADLSAGHRRKWKGLVARSHAAVVAHLPPDLTLDLLGFGRRVNTFLALAPGRKQFPVLSDCPADLVVLNGAEAAAATGAGPGEPPAAVFGRLLAATAARYVVMTGGGAQPTHFADRDRRVRGTTRPADLGLLAPAGGHSVSGLGAGDVVACVLARCLALGQAVDVAAGWARLYATAHVCGRAPAPPAEVAAWAAAHPGAFPAPETAALPRLAA